MGRMKCCKRDAYHNGKAVDANTPSSPHYFLSIYLFIIYLIYLVTSQVLRKFYMIVACFRYFFVCFLIIIISNLPCFVGIHD